MSDHFSGYRYKQPWLHYYSGQNVITQHSPFAFNHSCSSYHPDHHFAINSLGENLLHYHHQPNYYLAEIPTPNPNLRIGMWGRGGAKAYFRFHGGIGDGCGGLACRNTEMNTAARPLQLFEALIPIDFQIGMLKKYLQVSFEKNPVIEMPGSPVEASSGTGVFFPVYPKRIRATKGKHVISGGGCGDWQPRGGGGGGCMKQENIMAKSFVGGKVMEVKECKDIDEIPIEQLLPPEWTY